MSDALGHNQAMINPGKGAVVVLRHFARIQTRQCAA